MKKIFYILAVSILGLSACSKNYIEDNSTNAIGFNSYTGRVVTDTKANGSYVTGANFGAITEPQIGVYAYRTAAAFEGTENAGFMVNQLVTLKAAGASASINYTPLRYWPKNGDKLSFFAYYPHNATGLTTTSTGVGGLGQFSFVVEDAAADQVDFMVADLVTDKVFTTAEASVVQFNFKHTLSQVKVFVQTANDYSGAEYDNTVITLNSLTFKGIKNTGVLNKATATSWGAWTPSNAVNYEIVNTDVVLAYEPKQVSDGDVSANAVAGTYLMMPQELTTGTVQVTIEYTITTGTAPNTATETYTETVDLATATVAEWESNNNIKYTFKIGPNPIQFAAVVSDWDPQTDSAITIE